MIEFDADRATEESAFTQFLCKGLKPLRKAQWDNVVENSIAGTNWSNKQSTRRQKQRPAIRDPRDKPSTYFKDSGLGRAYTTILSTPIPVAPLLAR